MSSLVAKKPVEVTNALKTAGVMFVIVLAAFLVWPFLEWVGIFGGRSTSGEEQGGDGLQDGIQLTDPLLASNTTKEATFSLAYDHVGITGVQYDFTWRFPKPDQLYLAFDVLHGEGLMVVLGTGMSDTAGGYVVHIMAEEHSPLLSPMNPIPPPVSIPRNDREDNTVDPASPHLNNGFLLYGISDMGFPYKVKVMASEKAYQHPSPSLLQQYKAMKIEKGVKPDFPTSGTPPVDRPVPGSTPPIDGPVHMPSLIRSYWLFYGEGGRFVLGRGRNPRKKQTVLFDTGGYPFLNAKSNQPMKGLRFFGFGLSARPMKSAVKVFNIGYA